MKDPLAPIKEQLHKLWAALEPKPDIKLGTVTGTAPLMVAVDGDLDTNGDPVPAPAVSLIAHTVGQRVICAEQHRRLLIIQAG